ncbi:hypothetical protein BH20ACI1_BH20ACI1_02620 [soil metagenome]
MNEKWKTENGKWKTIQNPKSKTQNQIRLSGREPKIGE